MQCNQSSDVPEIVLVSEPILRERVRKIREEQ